MEPQHPHPSPPLKGEGTQADGVVGEPRKLAAPPRARSHPGESRGLFCEHGEGRKLDPGFRRDDGVGEPKAGLGVRDSRVAPEGSAVDVRE